jgi:hypothetical protein
MFESLGGRKLVAALLTIIVGIVMAFRGGDVPPNLLHLLEVIFGGFSLANVVTTVGMSYKAVGAVEPVAATVAETPAQQPAPEVPMPQGIPVADAVQAFNAIGATIEAKSAETTQALDEIRKAVDLSQKVLSALADRIVK